MQKNYYYCNREVCFINGAGMVALLLTSVLTPSISAHNKGGLMIFQHGNIRNDRYVKAVRNKFGLEGYAIYNMLLEVMAESELLMVKIDELELLAGDFGIESAKLKEMIDYFLKIELFQEENGYLISRFLDANLKGTLKRKCIDLVKFRQDFFSDFVSKNATQAPILTTKSVVNSGFGIQNRGLSPVLDDEKALNHDFCQPNATSTPILRSEMPVNNDFGQQNRPSSGILDAKITDLSPPGRKKNTNLALYEPKINFRAIDKTLNFLKKERKEKYTKEKKEKNIYNNINNNKNKKIKEKENVIKEKESVLVKEIIDDLNQKAGKRYRMIEATKKMIRARLAEGFTVEDFKRVHTNMCSHWKDDPIMNRYLRPSTLYRPSKFESYLNMEEKKEWTWDD